jgi:Zn-dependent metalloprotease
MAPGLARERCKETLLMKSSIRKLDTVYAFAMICTLTAGCAEPAGDPVSALTASPAATTAIATPAPGAVAVHVLAARNAAALVASRPGFLYPGPNDGFVQGAVVSSGRSHYVPYERTYAGLPVVGGDFVLVTDHAGQIIYSSVARDRPIDVPSITPTLTRAAAEAIAANQLRSVTRLEGTQLVLHAMDPTARLAWESTVDGIGADGISRLTVDVDALTGAVLRTQERVMHGTGTAAWNGPNPVALNTSQSGGTFLMRDPTISNLSCQDAANNTIFSGPDDAWGNGNATVRETGCVDALFGAQTEARMLSQWLGRNAMDGAGGAWPIRVGLNQLNAFYDGTQVQIGHNSVNQWIGSIDVIAHEMGHGIDDHTPGGISANGTAEFIADAFGAATEWFANEPAPFDVPDFTVGEQINLTGNGPIRNMANPALLGAPGCYSSAIPSTEVHAAAGPGNHWFYLLAEGSNPGNGQPASPTCNGSTVVGLGVQTAIEILYNAMLMKTTGSSYVRYRTWTLQAARNLFPNTCTQFNAVRAAWDAVGVPDQPGDPICAVDLLQAKRIATGADRDGRLEVFYIGTDGALHHNWQTTAGGGWNGDVPPGGHAKQLAVGVNRDGRLELFYIGTDDALYHNWQTTAGGGWSGEAPLGGHAKQLAVGVNNDGRIEVFYAGTNDALYHNWQITPGGGWNGEVPLAGSAKQLAGGVNRDGRLEPCYIGTDDALYHNWQTTAGGSWNGEVPLGGHARQLAGEMNKDGRVEVFYIGTNDALYHNWQTTAGGGWNGEAPLGGSAKQLAGGVNSDGRVELFYVGTNDALYHNWQTMPGGGWSGEVALGGWAKQHAIGTNRDGRLELFYIGTDDALYHNWQTTPGGGWNGETRLLP